MKLKIKNALINVFALLFVAGIYVWGVVGFLEPEQKVGVLTDGCEHQTTDGLSVRVCDLPDSSDR